MPFAAKPMTEDEKKKNIAQNGQNISGSMGYGTGVPGQEAQTSGAKQQGSGNYANIQSYLDANKDQGDQMGQKVVGQVEQSASEAQNKINDLGTKKAQVQQYDPNEAYGNVTNLNDEQKNQYRTFKQTGGYAGPDSIDKVDGFADTQKKAQEAYEKVQATGNEFGQQKLLQDTYKRPQYSAGENRLDQVLLQNSAGSKKSLQDINQKYSGLNDLFSTTANQVGQSINDAKTTALKNKENVMKAEQDQWTNLLNPIQQRADLANEQNPIEVDAIRKDLLDDSLNADAILNEQTLAKLGLSEGQNLYGLNLASYFAPNVTQVGLNNVANADERAKYKALADLVQDPTRTQIDDKGKAINQINFDRTQFDADLKARDNEYWNNYNTNQRFGTMHPSQNLATAKELQDVLTALETKGYYNDILANSQYGKEVMNTYKNLINNFNNEFLAGRKIKKGST